MDQIHLQGADPSGAQAGGADSISQQGYTLRWLADDEVLHVTMSAPTTGWIAVGFGSEGAMKNADIVIGYMSDGEVHLRDDFGVDYTAHSDDVSLGGTDDARVVSGSEEAGRTTISFTVPLSSGDECDCRLVPGTDCNIIMANGPNGSDGFTERHQWAGGATIRI